MSNINNIWSSESKIILFCVTELLVNDTLRFKLINCFIFLPSMQGIFIHQRQVWFLKLYSYVSEYLFNYRISNFLPHSWLTWWGNAGNPWLDPRGIQSTFGFYIKRFYLQVRRKLCYIQFKRMYPPYRRYRPRQRISSLSGSVCIRTDWN